MMQVSNVMMGATQYIDIYICDVLTHTCEDSSIRFFYIMHTIVYKAFVCSMYMMVYHILMLAHLKYYLFVSCFGEYQVRNYRSKVRNEKAF